MSYSKIFKLTQANIESDIIEFSFTQPSRIELNWIGQTTDPQVGGTQLVPIVTNFGGAGCKLLIRYNNLDSWSQVSVRDIDSVAHPIICKETGVVDILADFVREGQFKIALDGNQTINTIILVRIII
jgi:hypothetical protein